jgi:hypothetical protein
MTGTATAVVITDDFTFATAGQSMWQEGAAATFLGETRVTSKWGKKDPDVGDYEYVTIGGITGKEEQKVAGTGVDIPNPAYEVWKDAYDVCRDLGNSENTCINGKSAKKVCAFGHCVTVTPKISGLGDAPPKTINVPAEYVDTRTGVKTELRTSGEAGIIPWIKASGGAVGVSLPVTTVLVLPDTITAGKAFTVGSTLELKSGAAITATAPLLKAGIDGIVITDNRFTATGCVTLAGCDSSHSDADVDFGRFGIAGIDTSKDHPLQMLGIGRGYDSHPDFEGATGVPGLTLDVVHPLFYPTPSNPDGVDDPVTPQLPLPPTPRLGDIEVNALYDVSGGNVTAGVLGLTTNERLFSFNMSLTGLGEFLAGSPGVLSNQISLPLPGVPDPKVTYTMLDIGVGPRLGLQQDFDFTPDAWVRLEFDQPVTRVSDGKVFTDGKIEFQVGDDVSLRFDGEVGDLVNRTFFMKAPTFSNTTSGTIDPGMKVETGCFSVTVVEDYECLFTDDYATGGLIDISVYEKTWTLAGFNIYSVDTSAASSVPTPGTLLLLAIGLVPLAFPRRLGKFRRRLLPQAFQGNL